MTTRFPLHGTILNSSSPWSSTLEHLTTLYNCTHTNAITTRTATLKGFPENYSHQVAFFGDNSESTINSYGYSPFPLTQYLEWIEILLRSDFDSMTGVTKEHKPIIVSITGSLEEVEEMLFMLKKFAESKNVIFGVEINASCPNIPGHPPPAYDRIGLESYFELLSKHASPLLRVGMKLPPFTYIDQFNAVISALQKFSPPATNPISPHPISFLTSTNTLGSGLVFEDQANEVSDNSNVIEVGSKGKEFALPDNGFGGLAGKAIHQLSLGNVSRLSNLLLQDSSLSMISIIGVGGVEDAAGVKRMRRAGANAVACATAFGREGISVFSKMSIKRGRVGKHRKHPGGRGLAGGQHHHRTNFDKYHYGYFGKVGMRHFHQNKAAIWRPVINVDKIASLIPEEQRVGLTADSTIVPVVDTLAAGYGKVLAKGRLPAYPIIVKARYVSRRAEAKINAAGGVVTIIA